ncbi:MAG: hypothetical protein GXC73_20390 [Chitinophagaceae bacterium]|nr:hypothetical protein [Chitinophagaceae bacterium]
MRKNLMRKKLVLVYSIVIVHTQLFAQTQDVDSIYSKKGIDNAVRLYHEKMGDQREVFNGIHYQGYPFVFENGHPYFNTTNPEPGFVVYDNIYYPGLLLTYDEVADLLILYHHNRPIQLTSERVSSFGISGHKFVRLSANNANTSTIRTGFYEVLYDGGVRLFKKETKKINEYVRTKGEGLLKDVLTEEKYFIIKDNVFYPIKNKRSVFQIYGDKRTELERIMNSKQLNYKKNKEYMLTELSAFFDQISK